jgi:hypothetical protein
VGRIKLTIGIAMMFGRNTIAAAAVMTLAAALAPAVAPHGVRAQTLPSVDAAGTCPSDDLMQQLNPAIDGSVRSQRERTGSPTRVDVPLYRSSSLTGSRVEKPTSGYDDDIVVMVGAMLGTTGPALVRRIRDNVCGWMDVRDLEKSATPLQLIKLPGFGGEHGRDQRPSRLDARVVVKNRLDRDSGNPQRAPIYRAPFDGPEPPESEQLGRVGYFEVLSVFDVRRKNGACRTLSEDGCFLRVGTAAEAAGSRRGGGVTRTRGWMLGKDVEVWPSPLAIYYKPGKEGLKIHETEPSARNDTPYASQGVESRRLAVQPPGRFAEPHDLNVMRFPVIRGTFADRSRPESRPAGQPAPPYVYEIVFSGQACLSGGQGCIPEPEIKKDLSVIGTVNEMASKIDVLFVVDTTESMGPYLRSVVTAIKRTVDDLATSEEASLRHSVVLYGDYNQKRDDGLDYFALPFSPVNDRSGIERLLSVKTYDDIHKDLPEAPFAALVRAISQANWRPDAAQRLIVWIADHGNRAPGVYHTKGGYSLTEDKTAQHVVAAIRETDKRMKDTSTIGGTKTHFVALQVKGGSKGASQPEFTKFVTDARTIADALGENRDVFKPIPAPANLSGDAEVAALSELIAAEIGNSVKAVRTVRTGVQAALGGDTSLLEANLPESLLAREYLEELGFPVSRLKEMGKRIQVVRRGFVFQNGADGDFRYWLGMRRPEFENFRASVSELCEGIPYSGSEEAMEDALLKLVKLLTFGDPQPGQNLRDYFARVFSVPADHISTVLEGTPDQFVRRLRQQSERPGIVTKVCRSAKLLDMVGQGQIVDNPDQDILIATAGADEGKASFRPGATPRTYDWQWKSPDARAQWFFVPMDYLP